MIISSTAEVIMNKKIKRAAKILRDARKEIDEIKAKRDMEDAQRTK